MITNIIDTDGHKLNTAAFVVNTSVRGLAELGRGSFVYSCPSPLNAWVVILSRWPVTLRKSELPAPFLTPSLSPLHTHRRHLGLLPFPSSTTNIHSHTPIPNNTICALDHASNKRTVFFLGAMSAKNTAQTPFITKLFLRKTDWNRLL